jgi:hypothetical protein
MINLNHRSKSFAVVAVAAALLVVCLAQVHARDYPSGQGTRSVFATDLDLDGDIDICAANSYDGTVTVFSNDGTGILSQSGVFAVGSFPMAVSASDLTGDGLPEIVVTNYISGTISILVNAGALVFGTATEIPTGLGRWTLLSQTSMGMARWRS